MMVEKIKWKISAWVGAGKFKWSRNDTVDPDVEYHLVHEDEVMEKLAEKDKELKDAGVLINSLTTTTERQTKEIERLNKTLNEMGEAIVLKKLKEKLEKMDKANEDVYEPEKYQALKFILDNIFDE